MGIARTFQNIRLFSNMSVLDNVKVGMHNATQRESQPPPSPTASATARQSAWQRRSPWSCWTFSHLTEHAKAPAGSLPYGAQRRLEIVRALATEPKILLLDEPAAGMNPSETAELMENIRRIRDTFEIAIMLIEHDMNLVMGICEGICVLNYGKIIAKGISGRDPGQSHRSSRPILARRGSK